MAGSSRSSPCKHRPDSAALIGDRWPVGNPPGEAQFDFGEAQFDFGKGDLSRPTDQGHVLCDVAALLRRALLPGVSA